MAKQGEDLLGKAKDSSKSMAKWKSNMDEVTNIPNPFVNYTPTLTVYELIKVK